MALDASETLGSPQLAGVKVNPRGFSKSLSGNMAGASVGGLVGAGISAAKGMKADKEKAEFAAESVAPKFGKMALLVATAEEVALVELKPKLVSVSCGEVLARVPRSDVASVELGGGKLQSDPLTLTFTNGGAWELEVSKAVKKSGKAFVEVLNG
jgi:hypothetical protein